MLTLLMMPAIKLTFILLTVISLAMLLIFWTSVLLILLAAPVSTVMPTTLLWCMFFLFMVASLLLTVFNKNADFCIFRGETKKIFCWFFKYFNGKIFWLSCLYPALFYCFGYRRSLMNNGFH